MQAKLQAWSLLCSFCLPFGGQGGISCEQPLYLITPGFPSDHIPIRTWALIFGMSGLIVLFWFVAGSIALRYFVSAVQAVNVCQRLNQHGRSYLLESCPAYT